MLCKAHYTPTFIATCSQNCAILDVFPASSFIIQNEVKWVENFPSARSDTSSIVQLLIFVLQVCSMLAIFKAQRFFHRIMAQLCLQAHGVHKPKYWGVKRESVCLSSEVKSYFLWKYMFSACAVSKSFREKMNLLCLQSFKMFWGYLLHSEVPLSMFVKISLPRAYSKPNFKQLAVTK